MQSAHRLLAVPGALLAAVLALGASCGDDPVAPAEDRWVDVALPSLGRSALMGIAAYGTRVLAIAVDRSTAPPLARVVQTTGGAWELVTIPSGPASTVFLGVCFDTGGQAVLAGGTFAGQAIVLDERTGWSATTWPGEGFLQAVTAGGGDSLLAVGTASGGLSALRSMPGVWQAGRAGFTSQQEKGLVDVSFAGGTFVACGWDDSTGAAILRSLDATGWKPVDGPGTVDIPEVHSEHRAVWRDPDGALWLGGASIDGTNAVEVYRARLSRRPPDGDWFDVVLPDAPGAEAVNDILRAADGSIYLACGETNARVLRWDGMTWQDEQPAIPGRFLALAETADGSVYAAGVRMAAPGQELPLLRRRRPS